MAGSRFLTIPALERLDGIRHAFTTRRDGLGGRTGGIKSPDDWKAVAEAFNVAPERVVTVHQVHGDRIVSVDESNYRTMAAVQADGMITKTPGIAIGVETADCVPVLLYHPGARVAAAVHAGWRSTVQMIVQKAVRRMEAEFGAAAGQMIAAIGPAIGPECYEVDDPVMGPLREAFPFWKELVLERGPGRWGLDLVKANRLELERIGLEQRNVHALAQCTACRPDLFYSFRAEGRTGRMLSVIMIRP